MVSTALRHTPAVSVRLFHWPGQRRLPPWGPHFLNAPARTPFAAGLAATDLAEMSGGRPALAVGSGNNILTRSCIGVNATIQEDAALLRLMMAARPGVPLKYQGPVHSIHWTRRSPAPIGELIPIYIAALLGTTVAQPLKWLTVWQSGQ